jgi:hypothetical protein
MTVNIAALNIAPNRRYIIFFAYIYRWNLFYSIIVTNAAILVCSGSFWNYRQRKRRFRFQRVSQTPLGFQHAEWVHGVRICTKYLSMRSM